MHQTFVKVSRVAALAFAVSLATGCATITQEQFDAVSATANNALNEARAAKSAADSASQMASDAMAAAQAAQSAADASQRCCDDVKAKLDRMFEDKMRK